MKVNASALIILLIAFIAPASIADVQCTVEAVDLFNRGNQADKESRLLDARSLYTQAAQQCDRYDYWMAVGNIWVNDFLGESVETVNEEGGPAIEAYGRAFEAARRNGDKIEGATAARALVELGLRSGDPIRANDWLLLAQELDPSNPALTDLQREVEYGRAELSTSEIETGLSPTRGIGRVHTILMNGTTGSAYWDSRSEPAFPESPKSGGGGRQPEVSGHATQNMDAILADVRVISIPINFNYNSTKTTDQTAQNIENLATVLVSDQGKGSILLIGHADARGEADYNMKLSRNRANEIRLELESLQPALVGRLSVLGRGELEPVDQGTTERAYANNRRLEIVVKD